MLSHAYVPAIHVFARAMPQDVDARNKCGHDSGEVRARDKSGHDEWEHRAFNSEPPKLARLTVVMPGFMPGIHVFG